MATTSQLKKSEKITLDSKNATATARGSGAIVDVVSGGAAGEAAVSEAAATLEKNLALDADVNTEQPEKETRGEEAGSILEASRGFVADEHKARFIEEKEVEAAEPEPAEKTEARFIEENEVEAVEPESARVGTVIGEVEGEVKTLPGGSEGSAVCEDVETVIGLVERMSVGDGGHSGGCVGEEMGVKRPENGGQGEGTGDLSVDRGEAPVAIDAQVRTTILAVAEAVEI
jgi:hypothetical protein